MMMTLLLCALLLVSVGAVLAQDEETSAEHDPAAEQHTEDEAAAEGEAHDEEGESTAAAVEADAHSAEAENLPQGMSWLVFLIGLGGILLVGLVAARGGPDGAIEDEVPAKQE
jgi:hypothetical protein